MRFPAFLFVVLGILLSGGAMGGGSIGGGGWGKTKLLLQSFAHSEAVLTVDGMTNITEIDTTPLLKIPEDEYKFFSDELCKLGASDGNNSFILPAIELEDGSVRTFGLSYAGVPCRQPLLLRLDEVVAESEKDAE
jgi:hypothetical protein